MDHPIRLRLDIMSQRSYKTLSICGGVEYWGEGINYHIWENPRSKWRWSSDYSWPMFQPYFHDDPMINLLPHIPIKYPYDLCNRDTIYYIISQSIDQFYISLLIFVDPTIRMLLKLPKSSKDLQQNIAKPRCFALRQAF